jgi:hypothetical protein
MKPTVVEEILAVERLVPDPALGVASYAVSLLLEDSSEPVSLSLTETDAWTLIEKLTEQIEQDDPEDT